MLLESFLIACLHAVTEAWTHESLTSSPPDWPCAAYTPSADEEMDEEVEDTLLPESIPGPGPCSFLTVGQSFAGSQRLSSVSAARSAEDWKLVVRIQVGK